MLKRVLIILLALFYWGINLFPQCSGGFLGEDRVIESNENFFALHMDSIFGIHAEFKTQSISPIDSFKTNKGNEDSVVEYRFRILVIAILKDGCRDTALINIGFPNSMNLKNGNNISLNNEEECNPLGFLEHDTIIYRCKGEAYNLNQVFWQFPSYRKYFNFNEPYIPKDFGVIHYFLFDRYGCRHEARIDIRKEYGEDADFLGEDKEMGICKGNTADLTKVFNSPIIWNTYWSTETPKNATKGIYRLVSIGKKGCTDTAFVQVIESPTPYLGENSFYCIGGGSGTGNLQDLLGKSTTGLTMNWGTNTPHKAGPGEYNITAINTAGCVGRVTIELVREAQPDLGEDFIVDVCEGHFTNLMDYIEPDKLLLKWNIAEPESAPVGNYELIGTDPDTKCKDTLLISVQAFSKSGLKDTTVFACDGKTFDLNTIYNPDRFLSAVWSAVNPSAVPAGRYSFYFQNEFGCEERIRATVITTPANNNGTLSLMKYDMTNAPFTTNNFRTIVADKFGNIYAGSQGGGLYFYNGAVWVKSSLHPENTFKDLIEFKNSGFGGENSEIWAASIGHGGINAYAGGIDKIVSYPFPRRIEHLQENHYGSYFYITGTNGKIADSSGGLSSRFANSLVIGSNNKLYATLGQSIRYDTILKILPPPLPPVPSEIIPVAMEGGVFERPLPFSEIPSPDRFRQTPIPQQLKDVRVYAAGWRNEEEVWFAVDRSCFERQFVPFCVDPYIVRYSTKGPFKVDLITEAISPIPFTTKNFLTIRSIFTDPEGRTYVGMSDGIGIAVLDKNNKWEMVTPVNSRLPVGAGINFNAITEVNGKIWIGTTQGLLVYNGTGSLTDCNSYVLYTTENGLPSNNVTDVAYDALNGNIWLTTDNGVCSFEDKAAISGIVYSVNIIEKKNAPGEEFKNRQWINTKKEPLIGAIVKFFNNKGDLLEAINIDATGAFKWRGGKPGELYRVVVDYFDAPNAFEYKDVSWNAPLGEILMMTKSEVLSDIRELEINLTERFAYLPKIKNDFFPRGFDTTDAHYCYDRLQDTLKNRHSRFVENILLGALTFKSVKNLTESSAIMGNNMILNMTDAIETLLDITSSTSNFYVGKIFKQEERVELFFVLKNAADMLSEALKTEIFKTSSKLTNTEKKNFKEYASYLLAVIDAALEVSNNKDFVGIDEITGFLRDNFEIESTDWLYTELAQKRFFNLVGHTIDRVYFAQSPKLYDEAFNRVYKLHLNNEEEPSIRDNILNLSFERTSEINNLLNESKALPEKYSAEELKEILGTNYSKEELEAKAEQLAKEIQNTRMNLLMEASVIAVKTAVAIADSALKVLPESGFSPLKNEYITEPSSLTAESGYSTSEINISGKNPFGAQTLAVHPGNASSLQEAYLQYKQKLTAIKTLHTKPFDSLGYSLKSTELRYYDSLYTRAMSKTLHTLWPAVPGAMEVNPGFESRLDIVIDSFVAGQYKLRQAYFLKDIAYRISSNKTSKHASIDSLIDKILLLNDSAVAGIDNLLKTTRSMNITGPATLVQDNVEFRFNHQHGSSGQAIYTFFNYGEEVQYNVAFKISTISGGFTLTGNDSLFINSIFPGEAKVLVVNFTAPQVDTIGSFNIRITADNGSVPSVQGMLYTLQSVNNSAPVSVKSGLWSDPTTWSTGRVPDTTSAVTIRHNVTIDMDASCKTLKAENPAQVQVAAGKKFSVLE